MIPFIVGEYKTLLAVFEAQKSHYEAYDLNQHTYSQGVFVRERIVGEKDMWCKAISHWGKEKKTMKFFMMNSPH